MNTATRWKTFFKERFPIIPNILITVGLVSTSFALKKTPFECFTYVFTAIVFFFFLGQLRFMDELKDYQKDLIAHPERPLPRGLISTKEMSGLIYGVQAILLIMAFSSFYFYNAFVGSCLLLGIVWLYLMYNEFFVGKNLSKFPFLYALTHQIIILPMGMFAMSAINKIGYFDESIFWMSTLLLSTFFIYEISRKLDPRAIPLLGTYLIVSGRTKTILAITALTAVGVASGTLLDFGLWVYLPLGIAYFSHVIIYVAPEKYKITEGIVTLYLLYIIWMLPLKNLF